MLHSIFSFTRRGLLIRQWVVVVLTSALLQSAFVRVSALSGDGSANSAMNSALPYTPVNEIEKNLPGNAAVPTRGAKESRPVAPAPTSRSDLAARVSRIKVSQPRPIVARQAESFSIAALPLDADGNAVQGLVVKWKSNNEKVVTITEGGQAIAQKTGAANLIAIAGRAKETLKVKVIAEDKTQNKKVEVDGPIRLPRATLKPILATTSAHPPATSLPDGQIDSIYTSENAVGTPFGAESGGGTETAAMRSIREKPGSANFNFALPIVNLPGRGSNVGLALTYNSRMWNKSEGFTFGVDGNQFTLAPGFNLGYGSVDYIGSEQSGEARYSYTDENGTRHQLAKIGSYYETVDGSFIQCSINANGGTLVFTDGVRLQLSAPSPFGRRYPTRVTDRNGNYSEISYLAGSEGRIDWIKDTMGRYVRFHYDTSVTPVRLISVTVPQYNGTAADRRKNVRFYYERMTFAQKIRFQGYSPLETTPPPMDVIRYVYFPGTKTGYRYDYSTDYGMIRKITELRRMTVSNETSLTQEGSVINLEQQQESATTEYDYPNIAPPTGLLDVPQFAHRTDNWAGNLAGPAVYTYVVDDTSSTSYRYSTVTSPAVNGQQTKVISYIRKHVVNNRPQWDDGLVYQVDVVRASDGGLFSRTVMIWEPGSNGRNARMIRTEVTNEAQETSGTVYTYDQYNNTTTISERDFGPPQWLGPELRRTEITYVTSSNWTNRRLVRLPTESLIKIGSVVAARIKYHYDNDGADASQHLMPRSDLIMHESAFNPANQSEPICIEYPNGQTYCTPPSQGPRRGNVTSIETFADVAASTGISRTFKYDIAGNLVEAPMSCCQVKTFTYDKSYEYAYPIATVRGNPGQLTTSATYDFNTGLTRTTLDENGQSSSLQYDLASLRPIQANRPDGGYTKLEYFDELYPDPDQAHLHSYIKTTTRLDAQAREITEMSFMDGRGRAVRKFGVLLSDGYARTTDIEYDVMGRVLRASNPYFAAGPSSPTNPTGYWTTRGYDELSRVKIVVLPDNTVAQTLFQGSVTTVTDQAGNQRRQKLDALGRLIRVDEPNSAGNLGAVDAPNQPTSYVYDVLDNLTRVTQTGPNGASQVREFKYDALSRLTHERQVEARATLDSQGQLVPGGNGQWTGVYKYNDWDLLTDGYDARGVRTQFTYDGLNRTKDVTYSDGTPKVTYVYGESEPGTYFNKGRLIEVRTEAVAANNGMPAIPLTVQAYDYDLMGQVVRQRQTLGSQVYTLQYGYNQAGQLTSEQYPSGRVVNYSVDGAGRLNGVADATRSYASNFSYSSNGGLLGSVTMGNGVAQTMSYTPQRLQLERLSLTKNGVTIQRYDYKYGRVDAATGAVDETKNTGQIARIESFVSDESGQAARQSQQRFSYDSLDRLSQAGEYRGDTMALTYRANYGYDRWGNRFQRQADNAQNLPGYVRVEDADVDKQTNRFATATGITYDDEGNITADPKFRQLQYRYDANGRQTRSLSFNGTGTPAVSVFDGNGQRVATQVNAQWRYLVYNITGKVVAEYGGQAASGTGGLRYMMADHQGSTRVVMNASGTATARYDFQPFGEVVGAGVGLRTGEQGYDRPDGTRQRYAMTERDEATQTDHTLWRKYDSRAGSWTTPDPSNASMSTGNPQSFNRYAYVGNDPVNFVDPSGLQQCWGAQCSWGDVSAGFWGSGNLVRAWGDYHQGEGQRIIEQAFQDDVRYTVHMWWEEDEVDEDGEYVMRSHTDLVYARSGFGSMWTGYRFQGRSDRDRPGDPKAPILPDPTPENEKCREATKQRFLQRQRQIMRDYYNETKANLSLREHWKVYVGLVVGLIWQARVPVVTAATILLLPQAKTAAKMNARTAANLANYVAESMTQCPP